MLLWITMFGILGLRVSRRSLFFEVGRDDSPGQASGSFPVGSPMSISKMNGCPKDLRSSKKPWINSKEVHLFILRWMVGFLISVIQWIHPNWIFRPRNLQSILMLTERRGSLTGQLMLGHILSTWWQFDLSLHSLASLDADTFILTWNDMENDCVEGGYLLILQTWAFHDYRTGAAFRETKYVDVL